jgi:RNA polymerase sigma factor (sigma-70 family)
MCVNNSHDSFGWERLLSVIYPIFLRVARRVARNWGITADEQIRDLIQEVCLKVSASASAIERDLPRSVQGAERYLSVYAANAIRDSLRAQHADKRGTRVTISMADGREADDFEAACCATERGILLAELDSMVEGSATEIAIFRLYYKIGLTAKEISQIPAVGLGPKGVESLIYRMTRTLRARIQSSRGGDEGFGQSA